VPELQQPVLRTITVPEVQERSTMKRIHQSRRLANTKSARREEMENAPTDESSSGMYKLQSRMRSRLSLGNTDSVSAIPTLSPQSRDTQLLLEINFRIKSYQPIWHPEKPKWISPRRISDLQKGEDRPGIKAISVQEVLGRSASERTYR